jgi:hypothetical protein
MCEAEADGDAAPRRDRGEVADGESEVGERGAEGGVEKVEARGRRAGADEASNTAVDEAKAGAEAHAVVGEAEEEPV